MRTCGHAACEMRAGAWSTKTTSKEAESADWHLQKCSRLSTLQVRARQRVSGKSVVGTEKGWMCAYCWDALEFTDFQAFVNCVCASLKEIGKPGAPGGSSLERRCETTAEGIAQLGLRFCFWFVTLQSDASQFHSAAKVAACEVRGHVNM